MIPKPQNTITARYEKIGTKFVGGDLRAFSMTATVHFYDEPALVTREVRVVRANRCLPTEMAAVDLQLPQAPPELALGICHCPPE